VPPFPLRTRKECGSARSMGLRPAINAMDGRSRSREPVPLPRRLGRSE